LRRQMTANPGIYQGHFPSVTHPPRFRPAGTDCPSGWVVSSSPPSVTCLPDRPPPIKIRLCCISRSSTPSQEPPEQVPSF
jgi:hypothetical protein